MTLFTWLIVGGANRIKTASADQARGGVMPEDAFRLLATESGRRIRYYANAVVEQWMFST